MRTKHICLWLSAFVLSAGLLFFMWRGGNVRTTRAELCLTSSHTQTDQDVAGWWESIRASLPEDIGDELLGIETGEETVGFEYIFSLLWRGIKNESAGFFSTFFILLGIVVLGGMAMQFMATESELKKPMGLILSASCALALWQVVSGVVTTAGAMLDDLTRFTEGLVPVMVAILAGGGSGGVGVATASGFSVLMAALNVLAGRVLAPLVAICFAFSLIGAVSGEMRIDGIAKNLKEIYMTVLGVVGVIATGVFALQTTLAAARDSMAMRTARFTVGNMIPFVGGTIGAAVGTVGSSLTVIKSTVGVGAVVAALMLILPPLLMLYFTRLSLNLAGAFARLVGFDIGEKLLGEFRGIFDMTLALTALVGVVFLTYIAVFLKTALPFAA